MNVLNSAGLRPPVFTTIHYSLFTIHFLLNHAGDGFSLASVEVGIQEVEQHGARPTVFYGFLYEEQSFFRFVVALVNNEPMMSPRDAEELQFAGGIVYALHLRHKLWRILYGSAVEVVKAFYI